MSNTDQARLVPIFARLFPISFHWSNVVGQMLLVEGCWSNVDNVRHLRAASFKVLNSFLARHATTQKSLPTIVSVQPYDAIDHVPCMVFA